MQTLVVLSGFIFFALLVADWWASQREWDLRQRLKELAASLRSWDEPLSQRRSRWDQLAKKRYRQREQALLSLAQAKRASHDIQLYRHFTIGPPQLVLVYGEHRLKIRLYTHTAWKLNTRYRVKLLALEPDDSVGWRLAVHTPETGRVAELAWLVTAG